MAFKRKNHGRNHSYWDGDHKVPGVTSYLQSLPKPALVGWAAGSVAEFVVDHLVVTKDGHLVADELDAGLREMAREKEVSFPDKFSRSKAVQLLKGLPNYDRDKAANRGTEVHDRAHKLAEGEEVEVAEEIVGHVDAYLKFRDDWTPTKELVERPIINRTNWYCGTFDLVADIDGLGRQLIDIKTSRSGIFGEVALQLAAYRYAEHYLDETGAEQPMPEIDGCCALWLRADGYDLYPIKADEDAFRVFRHLQQVAIWLDGAYLLGQDGDSLMRQAKGAALRPKVTAAR